MKKFKLKYCKGAIYNALFIGNDNKSYWEIIKGMRNRIIHEYCGTSLETIYDVPPVCFGAGCLERPRFYKMNYMLVTFNVLVVFSTGMSESVKLRPFGQLYGCVDVLMSIRFADHFQRPSGIPPHISEVSPQHMGRRMEMCIRDRRKIVIK